MKNQKGFATLEVILSLTIISVLVFIAVPKIDKVIEKILLDYEMKKFCNEVNLTRSLNRSSSFDPKIFFQKISKPKTEIVLSLRKNDNSYSLRQNTKYIRERHYLPSGMKLNYSPSEMNDIKFNSEGIYGSGSGTITLTSRRGEKAEIVFNTVGRWRGNRNVR